MAVTFGVTAVGVLVTQAAAVAPTAAGAFGPVAPHRVLDTRRGVGAPPTPIGAARAVAVQVAGIGGVPASGVSAVAINVTVTGPTAAGYVTAYADGAARPTASNLNFSKGQTVPNLVIAPVGADGKVDLYNGSAGTVQLIADVAGYYLSGAPRVAGAFGSVSSYRALDTRHGTGAADGPVAPAGVVAVKVSGVGGVPARGVSAVAVNVTVTAPSGAGYVTAYADGGARPTASNLNFSRGQTVPNLVIAPVGADGKIDLYNGSAGTVQLIADIAGYYASGAPTAAGAFGSVSPYRVLDTRHGVGALQASVVAGQSLAVQVAGVGGIPTSGVSAVAVNVTVTGPTEGGYITGYASRGFRPTASNLNFSRGQTVPNLVIAPVGPDGKIDLFNGSAGTVQLIADIAGYYLGGSAVAWQAPDTIDPIHGYPNAVSCRATTFCVAVDDDGNAVQYDGTTWAAPISIDSGSRLRAVSCASATFCIAVDTLGNSLVYKGGSWSGPVVADTGQTLNSVSCISTTFCIAVDSVGKALRYDGVTWTNPTIIDTGQALNSVSCISTTFCVAVDNAGNALHYNGSAWTSPTMFDDGTSASGVSCTSPTFCLAIDNSGHSVTYDGTSWAAPVVIGDFPVTGSCTSPTFCVAVVDSGFATIYDGVTWSDATSIDTGDSAEAGVSCTSATFCVSVFADGNASRYNGSSWTRSEAIDPLSANGLSAISCPSATFCVAVDGAGRALRYNGVMWSSAVVVDAGHGLESVSCASTTFCVAVDDAGNALRYDAGTWGNPSLIDDRGDLYSVSCASIMFCEAVDLNGRALRYDGSTWGGPAAIDSEHALYSVSCASATFCVAVDLHGALRYNGTTWTGPSTIDSAILTSVSCTSTTFCTAVDSRLDPVRNVGTGTALRYDGKTWSSPTVIDRQSGISSVSCTSSAFCVAVDQNGDAQHYDGSTWSALSGIDVAEPFSVSCAGETFCIALDERGRSITYGQHA